MEGTQRYHSDDLDVEDDLHRLDSTSTYFNFTVMNLECDHSMEMS